MYMPLQGATPDVSRIGMWYGSVNSWVIAVADELKLHCGGCSVLAI